MVIWPYLSLYDYDARNSIIVPLDLQSTDRGYLWLLRGKVVRQDEGEIGCTLHFQSVFANGREEPMKFSFVRSLWNHLRFHVQARTRSINCRRTATSAEHIKRQFFFILLTFILANL